MVRQLLVFVFLSTYFIVPVRSQSPKLNVIAYYSGKDNQVDAYPIEKLTHIIYSFCHLKENRLFVNNARDSATIKGLVSLKERYPLLKIMLSLGGWGGCQACSDVFATKKGRREFASSVRELNNYFGTDGIDLDWEYPAIEGYPGHAYSKEDRTNFTALIRSLRKTLGKEKEISFAAGGFDEFLDRSVEWNKVMPLIDRVNLMSYDLVSGFSTQTGHHTPLYSTAQQKRSADNAIMYLDSIGVPMNKIVIGAAFYGRSWEGVPPGNNALYQPGKFKSFVPFNRFSNTVSPDSGYVFFRDTAAQAGYAYNAIKKEFVSFDDTLSVRMKTLYAKNKGLNGIMFWELTLDKPINGLLEAIDKAIKGVEQ